MIFAKWVSTKDKTITVYNKHNTAGWRHTNVLVAKENDIIEIHAKIEIRGEKTQYVCKGVINAPYFWAVSSDLKFCESVDTIQEVRIVS
jgi:hypothetical protein